MPLIAGLLFMAGMRRSEVSALRWSDVVDATDGDGVLVRVRISKTNQEGEVNDVRFVKDGVARAIRTLRAATSPEPADRVVPLSAQMIGLRFTAAAQAAGVERRVTAHSGRVGLASELTSRGASTTDVILEARADGGRLPHYRREVLRSLGARRVDPCKLWSSFRKSKSESWSASFSRGSIGGGWLVAVLRSPTRMASSLKVSGS